MKIGVSRQIFIDTRYFYIRLVIQFYDFIQRVGLSEKGLGCGFRKQNRAGIFESVSRPFQHFQRQHFGDLRFKIGPFFAEFLLAIR